MDESRCKVDPSEIVSIQFGFKNFKRFEILTNLGNLIEQG